MGVGSKEDMVRDGEGRPGHLVAMEVEGEGWITQMATFRHRGDTCRGEKDQTDHGDPLLPPKLLM